MCQAQKTQMVHTMNKPQILILSVLCPISNPLCKPYHLEQKWVQQSFPQSKIFVLGHLVLFPVLCLVDAGIERLSLNKQIIHPCPAAWFPSTSKVSQKEKNKHHILTHIQYMEYRNTVLMKLFAGQQWRCRHKQTYGHNGGRRGWGEYRE